MLIRFVFPALVCVTLLAAAIAPLPAIAADGYQTGIKWLEPPVVTPGESDRDPPSDAIVLFDGTDLSTWEGGEWKIEDGAMVIGKGTLRSKQEFGDCQVHLEWSAPTPAEGEGQRRGNSGIFLMGRHEVQILDSYQNKTYFDGQAASIYKQTPPMANAMRPPGEWNTYDISWTSPTFDEAGELKSPAYLTLFHNGVLVINHFALKGDTPYDRAPQYAPNLTRGPIRLQDHGNPVRFRNIWVREVAEPAAAD